MRGPAWRALLLVLALALADAAAARFVVEKNSIQVTFPDELKGKYEAPSETSGCGSTGACCTAGTTTPKCFSSVKAWNAQIAGAAAVLVVDDKSEPLLTMDNPEEGKDLITNKLGDDINKAADKGAMLSVLLDWRESVPHPDERVEYEFWTNSNDECGRKCDMQMDFV